MMVNIYKTIVEARSARQTMPTTVGGFAYCNYIRETNDGNFAVISIPADCYLSVDTLRRYNLPESTFGWFDA